LYRKIYFLSKTAENWINAAATCHENGLEFLTLDTKNESDAFRSMVEREDSKLLDTWMHVGGVTKVDGTGRQKDWRWIENGKQIDFELNWAPGNSFTFTFVFLKCDFFLQANLTDITQNIAFQSALSSVANVISMTSNARRGFENIYVRKKLS
jgi:hypothetical protein